MAAKTVKRATRNPRCANLLPLAPPPARLARILPTSRPSSLCASLRIIHPRMASSAPYSSVAGSSSASAADHVTTLQSVLNHQAELEAEAREIMPYAFDECTYDKGALKQSVWACLDCEGKGVCYSCSLSCHAGRSTLVD